MNKDILILLREKQFINNYIESLIHGTIEIRKKNKKEYIYIHYKENGKLITKYIGIFTNELYNTIIMNNITIKDLRIRINIINKKLNKLKYIEKELNSKVKINIDFAKKNIAKSVYQQAILEGITTTYPDTESIIEGGIVNNLSSIDVMKIINLKHAWDFILNQNVILSNTDYYLLCEINKFVEEGFYYTAGIIRSTPVSISGTKWIPKIPIESDIKDEINKIIESKKAIVDKAIDLLLYTMKGQLFIDGNKRTSVIFANHYLIKNGKGLIIIPDNKVDKFRKLLINYYESNNIDIKKFLKDECYINLKEQ